MARVAGRGSRLREVNRSRRRRRGSAVTPSRCRPGIDRLDAVGHRGSFPVAEQPARRLGQALNGRKRHEQAVTQASVERLLPPRISIVECGRSNIIPRNPANALPAWLHDSRNFVAGLNLLDDAVTAILPVFAQNWFFVLRKR